jgi:general secretion pathway protein K
MHWHNSVISLRDSASMLTVPWCDPDFLQRFLRARGISREQAAQAADTWLDWLDEDDFKHLNGAERFDYRLQGITAWTPRNSLALQAKEEAGLVAGLQQPDVWQQIAPELVWTVRGGSNIHTASGPMLQALLGIPAEQAAQLINRRTEMGLLSLPDVWQITGNSTRPARGETVDFPNFIVAVRIRTTVGEAGEQVDAVLDFVPGETEPVTVLRYEQ